MEKQSTVFFSKAKGRKYFKVSIPFDFAVNLLNLRTDVDGQRLVWRIEAGKVVVSGTQI